METISKTERPLKFIEIIKPGTNIDFVGTRQIWVTISVAAVTIAVVAILAIGLNYGIDFAGGTEMQIQMSKPQDTATLRQALAGMGFNKQVIASLDGDAQKQYLVRVERFSALTREQSKALEEAMKKQFGAKLTRYDFSEESGERVTVRFAEDVPDADIGAAAVAASLKNFKVSRIGRPEDHLYHLELESLSSAIIGNLRQQFGDPEISSLGVEAVGSEVGKNLRTDGLLAVIYCLIGILIYVAFRFDVKFAPGAVLCLIHDATITTGLFAILGFEFNMTVLAAILALVGFSINDTIVVYDRIRENLQQFPEADLKKVINQSINETLARSIMTSTTVFIVAVVLAVFGGPTLFGFGFALSFGVIIGTYSSVYIAAPITIYLEDYFFKAKAQKAAAA